VAATFPAARGREALVRAALVRAALVRAALVRGALVRGALVRGALVRGALVRGALVRGVALQPVREDRAQAPRTGVHRRTAGPARPGSPDLRHQAGQAGLRRCASTRRPGPASKRRTVVTGPARRRSHRVR
jgi:hypothetical protein